MLLQEIIAYGPNTFGTHRKVVEIPKMLIKMSGEDAKNHPKRKKSVLFSRHAKPRFFWFYFSIHAQYRGSRSTKTENPMKKKAEAENNELKTNTELHPVVFTCLVEQ
jgi:hypothetical protein